MTMETMVRLFERGFNTFRLKMSKNEVSNNDIWTWNMLDDLIHDDTCKRIMLQQNKVPGIVYKIFKT
jgi:hypothetical protein